ncbi:TonB-dependent receptor [Taylorella equigenitalis]|uniref:TonB-dependent receptor domain-containing protein n=1 Tax=Taylorella equigenitalis TaxID=29575 RepID=UPI00237EC7E5|nr:TonB-dependent receptor [Taylorella equigenitalis]WDU48409.1 TonB-dependent receptor [Taylorella equigenitalis]
MNFKFTAPSLLAVLSVCSYAQNNITPNNQATISNIDVIGIKITDNDVTVDDEDIHLKSGGDLQQSIRTMPGVFTNQSSNQPGIEISIRGLSGYGRINTMIDGVPQNFKNVSGHTSSGNNLIYIAPELVSGVSVTKGVVSGAHGTGTLGGSANIQTLSEDDLLASSNSGGLGRIQFGNNGADAQGLLAIGHRFTNVGSEKGTLSFVVAGAFKNEDNYKTGEGKNLSSSNSSSNSPLSGLFKIRYKPNEKHQFDIGSIVYKNTFNNSNYEWDVKNTTLTAQYAYTPNTPLVNLSANSYYNKTVLDYAEGIGGGYAGRKIENSTWGFNISNTSYLNTINQYDLRLNYGVAWDHNSYIPKRKRGGNHPGKMDKASVFTDMQWQLGKISLLAGLRYDYFRLNGYRPPYPPGIAGCPSSASMCGDLWEHISDSKVLPNIGFKFDIVDGLSFYGMYARTYRPPSTHEVFYAGTPFRNQKGTGATNNLKLKGETSDGFDLALSYQHNNVLFKDDYLNFRLGYFNNRIKDFIFNDINEVEGLPYPLAMWVNSKSDVHTKGYELSFNYDAHLVYLDISYSNNKITKQPIGLGTGINGGTASIAPETIWTVYLGTRLLNERLNIGARHRQYSSSKAAKGQFTDESYWKELPGYSLLDLYGDFKINKNIDIYFTIENLEDKKYGYAGSMTYESETGRGRTFKAGVQARF